MSARAAPTSSSASSPRRSRAAIRRSSRRLDRARATGSVASIAHGAIERVKDVRAPGSAVHSRPRALLAATTAMNARARGWVAPSTRNRSNALGAFVQQPAKGDRHAAGDGRTFGGTGQRLRQDTAHGPAAGYGMPGSMPGRVHGAPVGFGCVSLACGAVPARHRRRRHRRQRRADPRRAWPGPRRTAPIWPPSPSWPSPDTRPRTCSSSPAFVADNLAALATVASATAGCVALVGFVDIVGHDSVSDAVARADGAGVVAREAAIRGAPRQLRNALAVCVGGDVVGVYHKRRLPNYGVFDEERWFAPGTSDLELYEIAGVPVGVSVCEDLWFARRAHRRPGRRRGPGSIVNVNASPYLDRPRSRPPGRGPPARGRGRMCRRLREPGGWSGRARLRRRFVRRGPHRRRWWPPPRSSSRPCSPSTSMSPETRPADRPGLAVGRSSCPSSPSASAARAVGARRRRAPSLDPDAEVYEALVLGTRDYLAKNGFLDAVVGLSGGVDSALVATVAVDALGRRPRPRPGHAVALLE